MDKVKVKIEHCYGIYSLEYDFDFSKARVCTIYAPNGSMKSSFAKTFKDYSEDKPSHDRVYLTRKSVRIISDENNKPLSPEDIFVIDPYNQSFKSQKISRLLVNNELKAQYDDLYKDINVKKEQLIKGLKGVSGIKNDKDIEAIVAEATNSSDFFKALMRLKDEVTREPLSEELKNIKHADVFGDQVLNIINENSFIQDLEQYINLYSGLLEKSTFFKKGFNHNNAETIAKNLDDNGFFHARHTVNVFVGGEKKEISNLKDLQEAIEGEKTVILNDPQLQTVFNKIDKKLNKNVVVKSFRTLISENPLLLLHLKNLPKFKADLWKTYLIFNLEYYNSFIDTFEPARAKLEEIIKKAKEEKTKWVDVVHIFNQRFDVPFVVKIDNQGDVILSEEMPVFKFQFKDEFTNTLADVEENNLFDILSRGERRALYILNIIFEVEARKDAKQTTLFVIDDIADSFDYKNKYAIVEYLTEINDNPNFYQIVLSHNFDFYRTLTSRLDICRENKLHVEKNNGGISLKEEKYQKNPLIFFKKNLHSNINLLIASIPFMRNLAEYTGQDEQEKQLTKLLHQKQGTKDIKFNDLGKIIQEIFKEKGNISLDKHGYNGEDSVEKAIYDVAESIYKDGSEKTDLEIKITLAIAIRLKAEEFLINKINNEDFIKTIEKNQTRELISKYKELYPHEADNIQLMNEVNIMTPENIHLNSFMYEPILDMGCNELKKLYCKVVSLSSD